MKTLDPAPGLCVQFCNKNYRDELYPKSNESQIPIGKRSVDELVVQFKIKPNKTIIRYRNRLEYAILLVIRGDFHLVQRTEIWIKKLSSSA